MLHEELLQEEETQVRAVGVEGDGFQLQMADRLRTAVVALLAMGHHWVGSVRVPYV